MKKLKAILKCFILTFIGSTQLLIFDYVRKEATPLGFYLIIYLVAILYSCACYYQEDEK